jgi:hypothetical protein
MNNLSWDENRKTWKGNCPRCGVSSFFQLAWHNRFSGEDLDVVECPGGHPFVITTKVGSGRATIFSILPINGNHTVPEWLPEEYQHLYSEMMFDFLSSKYSSAVAVAGIMLDAHINSFLTKNGDKRKGLKKRLDLLSENGVIDADQFADSTVARITRNGVVHPENIAEAIDEAGAEEVIDSVSSCLERYYKFRRAKALPAPEEQVSNPDTPEDEIEPVVEESTE